MTIILADGTRLENITVNGTVYHSPAEVTEYTFRGNLDKVTFETDTETYAIENAAVTFVEKGNSDWAFGLRPLSARELWELKIMDILDTQDARTSYLEMMGGF